MENDSKASAPVVQGGAKKNTGLIILTILLGVGTVGFGAAFFVNLLGGKDGSGSVADSVEGKCIVTQEQVNNAEEGTVAEVVADYDADSYVRGLIRKVDNKVRDYAYSMTKRYDDGVNYYADNYISKTSKSYGLYVNNNSWRDMGRAAGSGPEDFARRAVAQLLTDEGFSKDTSKSNSDNEGGYYTKDDYACAFSSDDGYLVIDCASLKWFTSADKALADSVNSIKGYNKDYLIGANTNYITTTPDNRYERAGISVFPANSPIGGHVDLFYRRVDGGEWTYITGTQGAPKCDDFDADAAQAYKGTLCSYEENGQWGNKYL